MQVERLAVTANELSCLEDVMYLAWRQKFVRSEKSNQYVLKRDFLLEQIALMEDDFERYSSGELSDEEFDGFYELRGKYVRQLFGPYYGADENVKTQEDHIYALATIGESMGWELALEEVNKRFPNRLKITSEKRGRHWKRASYFHNLKDYSYTLRITVLKAYQTLSVNNPPPRLELSKIEFSSATEWQSAFSVVGYPPSDENIFLAFQRVMKDRNHKYFNLFKAVNNETDILLLGSVKALERSLAIGRKR